MQGKKITGRMEGIRKRGRPRRRCTDEVEEDLKVMGIKKLVFSGQRPGTKDGECIGIHCTA